jgi:uncharacterized protein (DUF2384 family)
MRRLAKSTTVASRHRLVMAALQDEIDRLRAAKIKLRLSAPEIVDRAIETFESIDGAAIWLASPAHGLEGKVPVEVAATVKGRTKVLNLLGRIDHGLLA